MTEDTATQGARREYTCSFCGKKNAEVERMIAGPDGVAICNECVDLCNEIIDEAVPAPAKKPSGCDKQAASTIVPLGGDALTAPAVPSAVPYEVRRGGNDPSNSPRTMYPAVA